MDDDSDDTKRRTYSAGLREGREEGAAVAFGILGMGEAIRQKELCKRFERHRDEGLTLMALCGIAPRT